MFIIDCKDRNVGYVFKPDAWIFKTWFKQPEASFTIRPYLEKMTQSELHAIMTAGFASVTADVFGLFVVYGVSKQILSTMPLLYMYFSNDMKSTQSWRMHDVGEILI